MPRNFSGNEEEVDEKQTEPTKKINQYFQIGLL